MPYESVRMPKAKTVSHGMSVPTPRGMSTGYKSRPKDWQGFGESFSVRIPQSEWQDRIQERENLKVTNRDIKSRFSIESLDQNGTNYCWTNAPIQSLHYLQAKTHGRVRRFSPASVGSYIKNFRNVGGWGNESLERIIESGCNEISDWPANAIKRQYATPENQEKAQLNRVTEWYDLPRRDFDAMASALLLGHTVAIGLNWWGHEVLAIDLAVQSGKFVVVIDNSWGSRWGDNGLGILSQSKATPDDAVSPRVLTPRGAK